VDRGKPREKAWAGREDGGLDLFLRISLLFYTSAGERREPEIGENRLFRGTN
jgi:hypothetical protein